MSLGVGSELILKIGPEFGVWSCVTQSCNTETESSQPEENDDVEQLKKCDESTVETPWAHPLGGDHMDEAITEDDMDSDINSDDSSDEEALDDDISDGYESA